jgi:CO/xanthine dehydrogenase FAD-binding subunit
MRSYLPSFDLRAPANLAAALDLLASEPGRWRPFAGGTDLMVLFEAGKLTHSQYLSLWHLAELRGIVASDDEIALGALTTYSEILEHPVLCREFPLLCRAAQETGGIATQNRGTIGGNIANASPAADAPPALIVYDASLELVSSRGTRLTPYETFHIGYKEMDLAADELIRAVRLRRSTERHAQTYRKVGTRRAQAISKVCFAGTLSFDNSSVRDVRFAFGSVAPTVIRARAAEAAVRGRVLNAETIAAARLALASDIAPIDDVRSTERYRRHVAEALLGEFLTSELNARRDKIE